MNSKLLPEETLVLNTDIMVFRPQRRAKGFSLDILVGNLSSLLRGCWPDPEQMIVTACGSALSLTGRTACAPDAGHGVKTLVLTCLAFSKEKAD